MTCCQSGGFSTQPRPAEGDLRKAELTRLFAGNMRESARVAFVAILALTALARHYGIRGDSSPRAARARNWGLPDYRPALLTPDES